MSYQRITVGVMVDLKSRPESPVDTYSIEDYLDKYGLHTNNSESILYITLVDDYAYEYNFNTFDGSHFEYLVDLAENLGFKIDQSTARYFFSHWYDGVDAPHDEVKPGKGAME